jgi:UDPglucose 6-dehydrogenase
MENARKELKDYANRVEFCQDPYIASAGAHAIVVLTDWKEYQRLDFEGIFDNMQRPAFIFDGRNCLDHEALFKIGFNVFGVGKPERTRL